MMVANLLAIRDLQNKRLTTAVAIVGAKMKLKSRVQNCWLFCLKSTFTDREAQNHEVWLLKYLALPNYFPLRLIKVQSTPCWISCQNPPPKCHREYHPGCRALWAKFLLLSCTPPPEKGNLSNFETQGRDEDWFLWFVLRVWTTWFNLEASNTYIDTSLRISWRTEKYPKNIIWLGKPPTKIHSKQSAHESYTSSQLTQEIGTVWEYLGGQRWFNFFLYLYLTI